MRNTLSLKFGVGNGVSIADTARDAQRIADILCIRVDFDFNRVSCSAYPQGDALRLVEDYYEALNKGGEGWSAVSVRRSTL